MKFFSLIVLTTLVLGASFQNRALKDVVSIIQLENGNFDVLCKDHSREVISSEDLKNENLCPYIAKETSFDVLFVIDNSGSMGRFQEQLSKLAPDIIKNLKLKSKDFQFAATTTSAYRETFGEKGRADFLSVNGKSVFTSNDSQLEESLEDLILSADTVGSGDERPLQSLSTALEFKNNSGFYRNGFFHIVILTDEDDFSHDGKGSISNSEDENLHSTKKYFDYLYDLTGSKNNNLNFSVTGIGIFNQQCLDDVSNGPFLGRKIAVRVNQLVESSYGEQISLCDLKAPQF